MAGSIAIFALAPLVAYACERGLPMDTICSIVDTTPEELRNPDTRISLARAYALWAHVARALREPALPLRAVERKQLEHLRVLGFLVASSRDGWEALDWAVRYGALVRTPGAWSIRRAKGAARIEWSCPAGSPDLGYRLCNEAAVAMFLRSTRLLAGTSFVAQEASFVHRAPPDVRAHDAFFGCRVAFGAPCTGFVLDEAVIDQIAPRNANPALTAFLAEHAEAIRGRLETDEGLAGEVRAALIERLLTASCDMTAIARSLGNHPRTLRRRLRAEGTSFQQLLDDARREHAMRLLPSSSVTQIALLLGFSETSAFTRAFRRWVGVPPREFRARQAQRSTTR